MERILTKTGAESELVLVQCLFGVLASTAVVFLFLLRSGCGAFWAVHSSCIQLESIASYSFLSFIMYDSLAWKHGLQTNDCLLVNRLSTSPSAAVLPWFSIILKWNFLCRARYCWNWSWELSYAYTIRPCHTPYY